MGNLRPRACAKRCLNLPNDRAKHAGCEKPGTERPCLVFAEWWQPLERDASVSIQVLKLPGDLVGDRRRLIRSGQASGFCGVCSRAESVRTHMGDAGCLCGGPCGGDRGRSCHHLSGSAGNEPAANLTGGIQIAASKRSGAGDRVTRSAIRRRLRFEQGKDSLGAIRGPRRHDAAIGFAQRLRGGHGRIFAHRPIP
jgi:hypothetical protein